MHALRKFASTVKILTTLGMARTFGEYQITIGGGDITYAVYKWRGKKWGFPTEPLSQ